MEKQGLEFFKEERKSWMKLALDRLKEINQLKAENEELKKRVEELKNGLNNIVYKSYRVSK